MENEKNLKDRDVLNRYLITIKNVIALSQYKKRSGVRKYKQPKRNAYKIQDKSYGNLSVDVPKLMNEMKLDVCRGGKIIYQANADKSLVDLLKWYCDQKTLLFFLQISKLCLRNNLHGKF